MGLELKPFVPSEGNALESVAHDFVPRRPPGRKEPPAEGCGHQAR